MSALSLIYTQIMDHYHEYLFIHLLLKKLL